MGATVDVNGTVSGPLIFSPLENARLYPVVHVQVPEFFKRHVFTKAVFGAKTVPSGTVTSETKVARSVQL